MGTLWIFGDSFAFNYTKGKEEILKQQWHRMIGEQLNMPVVNRALEASSLEWLYYTWKQERKNIKPHDPVIVVLTDQDRRWLLDKEPKYTREWALFDRQFDKSISPNQSKAMKMYFSHLNNKLFIPSLLENWLYNAEELAASNSCPILIFSAFPHIDEILEDRDRFRHLTFADGYLCERSREEYVMELRSRKTIKDGRCNHLLPPNHHVLSKKIISWLNDRQPIDVIEGFHKNLIDGTDETIFAVPSRFKSI